MVPDRISEDWYHRRKSFAVLEAFPKEWLNEAKGHGEKDSEMVQRLLI